MQTPRALDQAADCAPALAWASNVLGLEVNELDQVGSAQQARGLHIICCACAGASAPQAQCRLSQQNVHGCGS